MENSLGITQQEFRDYYLQHEVNEPVKISDEPWYIQESETGHQNLCGSCKHIDFEVLLKDDVPINFGPVFILRDMISNHEQCNFCRLALNAMCSADDSELLEPEAEGDYLTCQLASLYKGGSTDIRVIGLFRKRLFHRQIFREVAFIQELHDDSRPFGRRLVSPFAADPDLARGWVNKCERDHCDSPMEQLQQGSRPSDLRNLRAIDVYEHCVTHIERQSRYIALSYVWGGIGQLQLTKSNLEELSQKGSLMLENNQRQIPQTVKDASHLVSLLNERYLWVDALCIIQDGSDKQEQIQNMDNIYVSALLTIVAASGKDANAGLSGIRPREDHRGFQRQYPTSVNGLKLVNTLPDLSRTVDSSVRNSRAWTYQERTLSKRLLFISEAQMYFRCMHGDTFVEDVAGEDSPQGLSPPNPQIRGMEATNNFEMYALAVEDYSHRNLSFNEDALDAVTGVLSYLRPRFRSEFLFGLPGSEPDMALLWQPSASSVRRRSLDGQPLFPSWSWAGWMGGARYWMGAEVLSRVIWRDGSDDGQFSLEEYRQPGANHGNAISNWIKTGPSVVYDSYHEYENPHMLFLHPIAPENQRQARHFVRDGSGQLHFRTLSVELSITGHHAPEEFAIMSCRSLVHPEDAENHRLCSLRIYNKEASIVGTVHVPGSIACALSPGNYRFILLSRTRLLSNSSSAEDLPLIAEEYASRPVQHPGFTMSEREESPDLVDQAEFDTVAFDAGKPWCLYNVMLLEMHGEASHRVGLGQVHVHAFLQTQRHRSLRVSTVYDRHGTR